MRVVITSLIAQGRSTEWLTSFVLLAFGCTLALPGDTFAGPAWSAFRGIGLDEAAVGIPTVIVAVLRLFALYINGAWRRSPLLRQIGAIAGAALFASLTMAFLWPSLTLGEPLTTGVTTYGVLALFDILAAHRSATDGERIRAVSAAT